MRSRDALARQIDEETRLHIELRTEALMRRGLAEAEARAEARRKFGTDLETRAWLLDEAVRRDRRMRIQQVLDSLKQDIGHALRTMLREPGLSAVIVLTLALGIGANATMFGLVDRVLLRGPSHVHRPGELRRFFVTTQSDRFGRRTTGILGYTSYRAFRDANRSFAGVAAYWRHEGTIGHGQAAESGSLASATWDFFPLLGVQPSIGRFFDESEDSPPDGSRVVVIGDGLWFRRFGGDPGVLGQSLAISGEPYTVIGVAPENFTGVELGRVDAWVPMSASNRGGQDWRDTWYSSWLEVVGRLRPGVTVEAAALEATNAHRQAYTGPNESMRNASISLGPLRYDGSGREPLELMVSRWLAGVSAIVLLIACANVMNLLLARSIRRRREVAVRLAMGIGRGRLFRLLLLHGVVLAATGGALALFVAAIAGPVIGKVVLPDVALTGARLDSRVLLFTTVIALSTGMLTSVIPAFRAGRRDLGIELKSGAREGGGRRSILRAALVLAQVTMTVVLLVGAGLFARSLATVHGLDLGFEPDRVASVTVRWAADAATANDATRDAIFFDNALDRIRAIPGVRSAALATNTPFFSASRINLRASGHDSIPSIEGGGPWVSGVTAGYFEATGLDLLEGRAFTSADRAGSEPVAIVNRTMADLLWPDGALDQCIYLYPGRDVTDPPCSRIVGVVEGTNQFELREPASMQFYVPNGQAGEQASEIVVRPVGRTDDRRLINAIRAALFDLDPGLAYVSVQPLKQRIDPFMRPWTLGATLFSLFAGLALLIAGIGLYSVIARLVADRTHEMGVRMALGADRNSVLSLVLNNGIRLVAGGLLAGIILALIAGRFIQDILFETSIRDPRVFASVALITGLAALIATAVPAWRAGRVDPAITLRGD